MKELDLIRLTDAYETQSIVVHLQVEIIDELFRLLAMHLSAEELDNLEVVGKINEAARLRRDYQ